MNSLNYDFLIRLIKRSVFAFFMLLNFSVQAAEYSEITFDTTTVVVRDSNYSGAKKLTIASEPRKSGPICGGANQEACENKPAIFKSMAKISECPTGSFRDALSHDCWTCPPGTKRTAAAVSSDRACSNKDEDVRGGYKSAKFQGPWCEDGTFYDPIRGGECWSCPKGYKRGTASVQRSKACISEDSNGSREDKFREATIKGKADCKAGEFKDSYVRGDQKYRYGGGCWTCPSAYDRTVFAVTGKKACQTTANIKYSYATKLATQTKKSCKPDEFYDITGITKKDIVSLKLPSNTETNFAGTCWKCPDGYKRNFNSVKSPSACSASRLGWYSQPYSNPGLFGLSGAEGILLDVIKNDPVFVKKAIDTVVKGAIKSGNKSSYNALFDQEQSLFINKPQESTAAAAIVLARMFAAVAKQENDRTLHEKLLLNSFAKYIQGRRTWIAEDALANLDAWAEAEKYWEEKKKEKLTLHGMLDYGTVPPDYEKLAMVNALTISAGSTAIGIATGSIPLLGDVLSISISAGTSLASFKDFDSGSKWVAKTAAETAIAKGIDLALTKLAQTTATQLTKQMTGVVGATVAKQTAARTLSVAGSAGPQIIIATSLTLLQMSLEQFADIQNARPKLLAAVAEAKITPDLERLSITGEGVAELMGHWAFAIAGDAVPNSGFMRTYKVATTDLFSQKAQSTSGEDELLKGLKAIEWKSGAKNTMGLSSDKNGNVYRYKLKDGKPLVQKHIDGKGWEDFTGNAVAVAGGKNNKVAIITAEGGIVTASNNGNNKKSVSGNYNLSYITANSAGHYWIVEKLRNGEGKVQYLTPSGNGFTNKYASITAARIAIGKDNRLWFIDKDGHVYRSSSKETGTILKTPKSGFDKVGRARDIAVGIDGAVVIIGYGSRKLFLWDESQSKWVGGLITPNADKLAMKDISKIMIISTDNSLSYIGR